MGCSICTNEDAVLVDREHKGTYWMCGDCVWLMIEDKRKLERVVRAAEACRQAQGNEHFPEYWVALEQALEALPPHLRGE